MYVDNREVIKQEDGTFRSVGKTINDVFISHRNEEKHMFRGGRKPLVQALSEGTAAWGIDAKRCVDMVADGFKRVKIISDKAVYECPIEYFLDPVRSFKRHFQPHGTQYFVNLCHFDRTERS
jgi:hypothetical protein